MKTKHKCVENGGCKAADCDGGMSRCVEAKSASDEFKSWQLDMINIIVNGLDLRPETVKAYREARKEHHKHIQIIVKDMCK